MIGRGPYTDTHLIVILHVNCALFYHQLLRKKEHIQCTTSYVHNEIIICEALYIDHIVVLICKE